MCGKHWLLPLTLLLCGFCSRVEAQQMCPSRPAPGTAIVNPLDLYSQNGVLTLNLSLQSQVGPTGFTWYCYVYLNNGTPVEAPTLRLNPGDRLVLNFTNNITVTGRPPKSRHALMAPMAMGDVHGAMAQNNPCLGGMVTATTTNIHFHGLNIAPVCHQDEVVKTIIPNNGVVFQYSLVIPANDPPGLYWYHPHPHGFSAPQVYGGAAGALIIGGTNVLTQGLPERVLTVRRNVDAVTDDDGQFTLNFEPANFPRRPLPVISMTAGRSEFWRVLNASTNGFLALQVLSPGPQPLQVIAIDGIPLASPATMTTIYLPPAGRVEFIVPALTAGTPSFFTTNGFNTGPIGDLMPGGHLASIVVGPGSFDDVQTARAAPPSTQAPRFSGLASVTPTATHSLYFSELNVGTNGPGQFFITEVGHKQRLFDPRNGAAITSKVGTVEDWTISNQTGEPHAFHIHQLHFLVTAINGVTVTNPYMADTITVPNWNGSGPYPSVTVRMDFRDPNIVGTFVYHCHILDHEDGGMMATIVVTP